MRTYCFIKPLILAGTLAAALGFGHSASAHPWHCGRGPHFIVRVGPPVFYPGYYYAPRPPVVYYPPVVYAAPPPAYYYAPPVAYVR